MGKQRDHPVVYITGGFDDLRPIDIRFLQEAQRLGKVHLLLYSDNALRQLGHQLKFKQNERRYYLEAIRFINNLSLTEITGSESIIRNNQFNNGNSSANIWAVRERDANKNAEAACEDNNIQYKIIPNSTLTGFPIEAKTYSDIRSPEKKVMVSGCFDWVHSGHIRFFEEASSLGELYVVVGHDANLRLLKGKDHPMFPQEERLYWVYAIRFVKHAMISSGHGWLDVEPEVLTIKPDIFAVNTDGDRPEKRSFFQNLDIEYRILERKPKTGLPARASAKLRGF